MEGQFNYAYSPFKFYKFLVKRTYGMPSKSITPKLNELKVKSVILIFDIQHPTKADKKKHFIQATMLNQGHVIQASF